MPSCINYLDPVPKSHSEDSLRETVKSVPENSYTPPVSQPRTFLIMAP